MISTEAPVPIGILASDGADVIDGCPFDLRCVKAIVNVEVSNHLGHTEREEEHVGRAVVDCPKSSFQFHIMNESALG